MGHSTHSYCIHMTISDTTFQVSEATLLPFLGGELGAKHAAVEEVIKFLPAVQDILFAWPQRANADTHIHCVCHLQHNLH